MTPQEAVRVATLIGELWPNTALDNTRKAFYANALTVIPASEMAVKAVHDLFVTERFQPTPGQVIDLALGLDDRASFEWQRCVMAATEMQGRRPISGTLEAGTAAIIHRLCGGIASLPVDDWRQLDRIRTRFVQEYIAAQREQYKEQGRNNELGF